MRVHGYFRSSAAYRLRIAIRSKGIEAEALSVHLRRGEQRSADFLALNPMGLVPAVEADGRVLTQSLAILEYLEETRPEPPLLPADPLGRARVRALACAVACDIHPLNNLRVLNYITGPMGLDETAMTAWYRHWVEVGFAGIEAMLAADAETGRFCHGDAPTLADVCLVPQVYNARRFAVDLDPYPTIRRIEAECLKLEPFALAAPELQPDAA